MCRGLVLGFGSRVPPFAIICPGLILVRPAFFLGLGFRVTTLGGTSAHPLWRFGRFGDI